MAFRIRTGSMVALSGLLAACQGTIFIPTPFVASVNGESRPAGAVGSMVVISGVTFGNAQGSSQVLFANALGGSTVAATISSPSNWTNEYIITTVPTGAFTGPMVVSTGGGQSGVAFTVTPNLPEVPFTPSAVSWTAGSPLPDSVSGNAVAYAQIRTSSRDTGFVYSVGGADNTGTPVKAVYVAPVTTTGSLGAWAATTDLPTGLAFHAVVAATQRNSAVSSPGYLYALGGSGNSTGAVYRTALSSSGSLGGSWTQVATLPAALHSFAAIVYLGSLYVVGGAANGTNAPVATAYRTPIQADGSIGFSGGTVWQAEPALPAARARLTLGANGLYLYAVGGDSTARSPNDSAPTSAQTSTVFFAHLSPSARDIASWSATGALDVARSAHTAVIAGGNMLVTGGVYAGAATGTNDESYAALTLADGTVGAFTVAAGANTIHLFNHGATGFLSGDGTFHVLVAGGDDVNAPGTKHPDTFVY